ncbi:MAG: oligosaccharide flippase family protein [Acidobacteria bacterium]|nr:oligosaccharide flippase family protein [Acidobacteriota bacterium]
MASHEDLASRAASSVAWRLAASLTATAVLVIRSVVLARWLPVEVFGVYALAAAVVGVTGVVASFGLGNALLHRCAETADERAAAATHFTLTSLFTLAWAAALAVTSFLSPAGPMRTALAVLTGTAACTHLTATAHSLLLRRVRHGRLALLSVADAALTTAVAIALARRGETLWALLATDIVRTAAAVTILCLWRPFWRPRLRLVAAEIRYFLRFGARGMAADLLQAALDRLDNLWTGTLLGKPALGLYSRAFVFASYPRMIVASPTQAIAAGAYAELSSDRAALSQAFFRSNAALLRAGFLLTGLLAVAAPELVVLLIGAKWLPMLPAFRLLLVFALLDPIKQTVSQLFVAVGRPGVVVQARLVQLGVLVAGLFSLGPRLGIAGVSLAVTAMQAVGLAILLTLARRHVDVSLTRLFAVPVLAFAAALLAGLGTAALMAGTPVLQAAAKTGGFLLAYCLVLLAVEGRQARELAAHLLAHRAERVVVPSEGVANPDRTGR